MVTREVVIPTSPEQLWDTLTQPDLVSAWFGSRVDWELRPGGRAHFADDDGTVRRGVVEAVLPGRHLRFRWWPEDQGHDAASQVSYDLEPEEGGTRLTVTEQPLPVAPDALTARAHGGGPTAAATDAGGEGWGPWDSRLFGCWAGAAEPVSAPVAAPVAGGRFAVAAGRVTR